jgi:hypothetical protein
MSMSLERDLEQPGFDRSTRCGEAVACESQDPGVCSLYRESAGFSIIGLSFIMEPWFLSMEPSILPEPFIGSMWCSLFMVDEGSIGLWEQAAVRVSNTVVAMMIEVNAFMVSSIVVVSFFSCFLASTVQQLCKEQIKTT